MATQTKLPVRKRGSLFDTVTQQELPFQWEPKNEEEGETKYAEQHVVGKELPVIQYVGGSKNRVTLQICLTGVAHVNVDNPTSEEVGQYRYWAQVKQNKQELDGGYIDNFTSVDDAQKAIVAKKKAENANLKQQIDQFRQLKRPQADTGTPHPVLINLGGVYTGRFFLLEHLRVDYETTNFDTMEPMEARLRLSFIECGNPKKV